MRKYKSKGGQMKTQTLVIVIAAIVVIGLIAGVMLMMQRPTPAPTPAPVEKEITIEQWDGLGGGDGYVFDMLVDDFNTEFKGKIKVVRVMQGGWSDVYSKLAAAYKAGTGIPDVVIMHPTELPIFKDTIAQPVDDFIRWANLTRDMFIGYDWDLAQAGGKMYWVPWDVHPYSMYVNAKMAEEYNISIPKAGEIKTPEDLLNWWRDARKKLPENLFPFGLPSWGDWWLWWCFTPDDLLMKDGKVNFRVNTPDGVYAFKVYKTIVDENLGKAHTWEELAAGLGGDCLSWIHGPWMQATFDKVTGFEYTVVPIFGPRYKVWASGHSIYITKANGDERTKAAWQYILWLLKPKNNGRWGQYAGHIPAVLAAQNYPPYAALATRAAFAKQAELGFKMLSFHELIWRWGDVIQPRIVDVIQGTMTPEEAAAKAQADLEAIMAGE
jgi:ABC-type glycerol-3-phosphate transport system substrate-binding protein